MLNIPHGSPMMPFTLGPQSVKLTNAILNKQPDASIIIPPPSDAVISQDGATKRDQHIRQLEDIGRMAWQK